MFGGPRHGPRPIDVDLLLLGDLEHASERLTIPHRDLAERRFVLVPLLELDPEPDAPRRQLAGRRARRPRPRPASRARRRAGLTRSAGHPATPTRWLTATSPLPRSPSSPRPGCDSSGRRPPRPRAAGAEALSSELAANDLALRQAIDAWRAGGDPPKSPPPRRAHGEAGYLQATVRSLAGRPTPRPQHDRAASRSARRRGPRADRRGARPAQAVCRMATAPCEDRRAEAARRAGRVLRRRASSLWHRAALPGRDPPRRVEVRARQEQQRRRRPGADAVPALDVADLRARRHPRSA